jgi:hypothetical protein
LLSRFRDSGAVAPVISPGPLRRTAQVEGRRTPVLFDRRLARGRVCAQGGHGEPMERPAPR